MESRCRSWDSITFRARDNSRSVLRLDQSVVGQFAKWGGMVTRMVSCAWVGNLRTACADCQSARRLTTCPTQPSTLKVADPAAATATGC